MADISLSYTFAAGDVISAAKFNTNFTELTTGALNKAGDTMTGTLTSRAILPSLNATYALGTTSFRYTTGWFSSTVTAAGFAGPITGDVTGNLTGNVTGNVTGNLTGNVTGNTSGSSGSCTGLAATATALATPRAINGVTFDGTAAITITAAAGTLTGTTLASNVVSTSITSTGTITSGTWSGSFGAVSGANLTTLNASNLSSGTVGTARLGSGSATSSTFLRGDQTWASVAPTAWVTLTYAGDWATLLGFADASYRRDSSAKFVYLKGLVKSAGGATGNGSPIGTLPAGFRPTTETIFSAASATGGGVGTAEIRVGTGGDVFVQDVNGGVTSFYVSLDGIVFATD